MVMAKVMPSKGVQEYAVEVVRKFVEQLGYNKAIVKSDSEPSTLVFKEAVRREASVEIVMEETPVGEPPGERSGGEYREECEGPAPGVEASELKVIIGQHRGW
jgi:hypothetical protein